MKLEDILPFEGGCSFPVQYEVEYEGKLYYLRYRHSSLTIDIDDQEVFEQELTCEEANDGEWSDRETTVYLYLISCAIKENMIDSLELPKKHEIKSHPMYIPGNIPIYHINECKQSHEHILDCFSKETFTAKELYERRRT